MTPRKIIVYIATSADGFIARADGGIDWLDRPRPKGNYGMGEFFKSIDTILWGRGTLDESLSRSRSGGFGKGITNYAFSRTPPATSPRGVEFVREPIPEFSKRLRSTPGKDIWMMGGGELIASFLDAGQIDEFSIHVVPGSHRRRDSAHRTETPPRTASPEVDATIPGRRRASPLCGPESAMILFRERRAAGRDNSPCLQGLHCSGHAVPGGVRRPRKAKREIRDC